MHRVSGKKVKWTPEMDADIITLRMDGMHSSEIAQRLGVSIASVDARYYRLKRKNA